MLGGQVNPATTGITKKWLIVWRKPTNISEKPRLISLNIDPPDARSTRQPPVSQLAPHDRVLRGQDPCINDRDRKRVQRLLRRMGIEALGPRPRTTNHAPGHKIYPYLLRDTTIGRPIEVWTAADITYIPIAACSSTSLRH